jgi:2-methylcitrate dehydratase PrpD
MTLAQFEPARYDDPALRRFAERVEVRADPALSGVQAVVEIETVDGKTLSARCEHPKGSPENRLSRREIEGKFRTYAKGRLSDAQVDDVIGAVFGLERLSSVRSLMDMLRETPKRERVAIAAAARA